MLTFDNKDILSLGQIIGQSRKVVVVSHVHPDGDALGSSVALSACLRALGKEVSTVFPDSIPDNINFIISSQDHILTGLEEASDAICACDTIFALDFNGFSRTDVLCDCLANSTAVKVLIDHHLNPQTDEFDLVFSKTDISSASEVLFWVLTQLGIGLGSHSMDALMAGMTTDTNNFANSVYPSTFEMASRLVLAGVDRDAIVASIYNNYRENRYRLLGYLLSEKLTITSEGVAYMILDSDELERFDVREGDTEAFVNMPLGIDRVKMSIFLRRQDDLFRVSIRSKKGTSANALARQYFHGGGHEQASGGKLFIGADVADASDAAVYIEKCTRV